MIQNNKRLILRYVSFLLALGVMVFIFCMSSQNSDDSSATSGGFIRAIAPFINPKYNSLSQAQQEAFISDMQFIVRKGAHFCIYTVLGIFLSLGFATFKINSVLKNVSAWSIGALYAASDEFHQSFVPGRSGEIRDFLIDASGVLLGCVIVTGFCIVLMKTKKQSSK